MHRALATAFATVRTVRARAELPPFTWHSVAAGVNMALSREPLRDDRIGADLSDNYMPVA